MSKILIVDDQHEILHLLAVILRKEGRTLLRAWSAEEAFDVALKEKPDLILLDVMMPGGMDGFELAGLLRKEPATASCAIVIMTAKEGEDAMALALAAGADDFIRKPFNMASMMEKVAKLLEPSASLPAG